MPLTIDKDKMEAARLDIEQAAQLYASLNLTNDTDLASKRKELSLKASGGVDDCHLLEHVNDRHLEAVRLMTAGYKPSEVTQMLGTTSDMIHRIRRSPQTQKYILAMRAKRDTQAVHAAQELEDIAPLAVAVLEDVMMADDTPAVLKIKSATSILDRAGYGPVTKSMSTNAFFGADEIDKIKKRAFETTAREVAEDAVYEQAP